MSYILMCLDKELNLQYQSTLDPPRHWISPRQVACCTDSNPYTVLLLTMTS